MSVHPLRTSVVSKDQSEVFAMALLTREMANGVCVRYFGADVSRLKADHDKVESSRFRHSGGTLSDNGKDCESMYHSSVTYGTVGKKDAAQFCIDYLDGLNNVILPSTRETIRASLRQILSTTMDVPEVANKSFDIRFPTTRRRQMEGMFILLKKSNGDTNRIKIILALYSEDSSLTEAWSFIEGNHDQELINHYLQYKIWGNLQGHDAECKALDNW